MQKKTYNSKFLKHEGVWDYNLSSTQRSTSAPAHSATRVSVTRHIFKLASALNFQYPAENDTFYLILNKDIQLPFRLPLSYSHLIKLQKCVKRTFQEEEKITQEFRSHTQNQHEN